ncbi:hypothetical protein GCM10009592_24160 [Brachybacterium rhamnosum]
MRRGGSPDPSAVSRIRPGGGGELADPDGLGEGVAGAVSRYVAMTRATADLVVLRP